MISAKIAYEFSPLTPRYRCLKSAPQSKSRQKSHCLVTPFPEPLLSRLFAAGNYGTTRRLAMLFEFSLATREMFRQDATESFHRLQPLIEFREFALKQIAHLSTFVGSARRQQTLYLVE
jgi:hypothetical protein